MDLLLHLRGFLAVVEQANVSRAAAELGIDQPLLSRRLRSLEEELGVQLLDRSRRQIELTAAGRHLAPRARALLDQADHLLAAVSGAPSSNFTVGLPAEADPTAVARLMTALDAEDLGVAAVPTTFPVGAPRQTDLTAGWWIEPSSPAEADWATPLGVAGIEGTRPWIGPHPDTAGTAIRLGDLRPRRGRPGAPVMILEEDEVSGQAAELRNVADRAGLGPRSIRTAPAVIARAEVLAGRAVMICSARQAGLDGLVWTPLADPALRRWYRLVEVPPVPGRLRAGPLRSRILHLIAAAVDAAAFDGGAGTDWRQS